MINPNALVNSMLQKIRVDKKKRNNLIIVLLVLSFIVTGTVFYNLRTTGLTLAGDADCGYTEHTHSDSCVERTLVCNDKSDTHTHSSDCYDTVYTCGYNYEHIHTSDCYSDEKADVETKHQWQLSVNDAEITGLYQKDLLSVALTQVGYAESTKNFKLSENLDKKGYTRYGDWYGMPYADWNTLFVAFCLEYAHIPQESFPCAYGAYSWELELEKSGLFEKYDLSSVESGDVVFFDVNCDGKADKVGIVASKNGSEIYVIEGDSNNAVEQNKYYITNGDITGYVSLSEIQPILVGSNAHNAPAVLGNDQVEFGEYITGVVLQYRPAHGSSWTDIDSDGVSITYGDNLRFTIQYTIPSERLDTSKNTIVYQIPQQIRLVASDSGIVRDSNNDRMGTYSISETGFITITFDDNTVELNEAGSPIAGFISFDCSVDDISADDDGYIRIDFNGTIVNIFVDEKQDTEGTIDVRKTATVIDNVNGIAEYTVVVSSDKGTATPPEITESQ